MPIPKHQAWMQATTLGVLRPRSTQLKAVDQALLQYETAPTQQNLFRVRNAFEDWKRFKGAAWQQSDRNRGGAMLQLNVQLAQLASYTDYQAKHFTPQELQALSFMRRQRDQVIHGVFRDREVTFKAAKLKDRLVEVGQSVRGNAASAADHLRGKGKPASAAPGVAEQVKTRMLETAKGYFSVEGAVGGLEQIGAVGSFVADIIGKTSLTIAPVVGHIKDGYDLFTGWAKVGSLYVQQRSIGHRNHAIETGAPSAAFAALVSCLKEETKNEAISATTATTSFALKSGLAAVDGGAISGPVVGAAAALAEFMHAVALLAIEWRATTAVNKALSGGQLDIRLFKTYPLM
ncbi:MAG TPA: hypothetical protein VGP22_15015, partial [Albitalea sp.]|nr:hypothetical protein [Albitalea sp.]